MTSATGLEVDLVSEEIHIDGNQDKENGMEDSRQSQTSSMSSFLSPRRVSLQTVSDEQKEPSSSVFSPKIIEESIQSHAEQTEAAASSQLVSNNEESLLNNRQPLENVLSSDLDGNSDKMLVDTDMNTSTKQISVEVSMCSAEEVVCDSSVVVSMDEPTDSLTKDTPDESESIQATPSYSTESGTSIAIEEACPAAMEQG